MSTSAAHSRPLSNRATDARLAAGFLFACALAVPLLLASLVAVAELTPPQLVIVTLLALDTSLLLVLIGLVLPLYARRPGG